MREALGRVGASNYVYAGEVWNIGDDWLTFADYDFERRTSHDSRYVMVIQGDDHGSNSRCQTVLVVPLSSQIDNKRSWEDELESHETPLTKPSIVKLQLLQPVPREALIRDGTYEGCIDDLVLGRVVKHLLSNLGIT